MAAQLPFGICFWRVIVGRAAGVVGELIVETPACATVAARW